MFLNVSLGLGPRLLKDPSLEDGLHLVRVASYPVNLVELNCRDN